MVQAVQKTELSYTPVADKQVREALERMEFEYAVMASADVELRAETLLVEMHNSHESICPR